MDPSTLSRSIQDFDQSAKFFSYDYRNDARARRHMEARAIAKKEFKVWQDYHKHLQGLKKRRDSARLAERRTLLAMWKTIFKYLRGGMPLELDLSDASKLARRVAEMGLPETPAEWEQDPLKATACKPPAEVHTVHNASDLQMQILTEMNHQLDVPDPWFEEGSPHYARRQYALQVIQSNLFQNFYTLVIVCNAITLGFSANETIDTQMSTIVESVFTILYTYEIYIRIFGARKYPWRYPALWLDAMLWILAALDLWLLGLLNLLLGIPTPNMSMVMVLRLFRLTKIIKAAEKFSWVARPLRVIMIASHGMPSILAMVALLYWSTIFFFGMIIQTVLSYAKQFDIPEFSTISEATWALTTVVMSTEDWRHASLAGLKLNNYFAATVFQLGALLLHFLGLFMFSILTETIFASAANDDQRQQFKNIRDNMNLELIQQLLLRIDLKLDGQLDSDEISRAYFKHPFIQDILGMPLDSALQLLNELDQSKAGHVSINNYLIGMFKSRCGKQDIDSLLFENTLKTCESYNALAHESSSEYANNVKVRMASDYPEDGALEKGLYDECEKARTVMLVSETAQDLNFHDLDHCVQELSVLLNDLEKMVSKTDWSGVNEVTEGTIRISGMRLAAEMKRFAREVYDWAEETIVAEENLLTLAGRPLRNYGPVRTEDD